MFKLLLSQGEGGLVLALLHSAVVFARGLDGAGLGTVSTHAKSLFQPPYRLTKGHVALLFNVPCSLFHPVVECCWFDRHPLLTQ